MSEIIGLETMTGPDGFAVENAFDFSMNGIASKSSCIDFREVYALGGRWLDYLNRLSDKERLAKLEAYQRLVRELNAP